MHLGADETAGREYRFLASPCPFPALTPLSGIRGTRNGSGFVSKPEGRFGLWAPFRNGLAEVFSPEILGLVSASRRRVGRHGAFRGLS